MPKPVDAQTVRTIAAKAACGDDSVRNYYAGRQMRSVTQFRIRSAISQLGIKDPHPTEPQDLAVTSLPGSKA